MIKFSKYQGLGNDFIISDDETLNNKDLSKLAKELCNNELINKADGLIFVKKNPLEMVFYNQDGSIGTMCGNGLRCFIKYCFDNSIIKKQNNNVLTLSGTYQTYIQSFNPFIVKANLGQPNFSTSFLKMNTILNEYINQEYTINGKTYYLTSLFMGTHHTVVFVNSFEEVSTELGETLHNLPVFFDRTNVDFVLVESRKRIKVKTFERGVGFTKACGTGACASFVVAQMFGKCDNEVEVLFEKGSLKIKRINGDIYMEGPAEKVFDFNLCI